MIENCGVTLTFDRSPQRAVTTEQAATDTLLALGQADVMVGTAHLKTAVLPEYQQAYEAIPVLAEKVPTAEQIRAVDPDFIYSPFLSLFIPGAAGERSEYQQLGVNTFVSSVECRDIDQNKSKTAFELIERDLLDLGRIFAAEERAAELVAAQNKIITEARAAKAEVADGTSIVYLYSVYKGAPYVAGNSGIGQAISDIVGVENAFADVDEMWPEVSWESIADRNPTFIVLGDLAERGAPGDPYQDKIDFMKADPAMSQLDAVINERFIIVPGIELDASVRSAHALELISKGIADHS